MNTPIFNRITIIGLGLIGSSIARAAHQHKLAGAIIGYDKNEISLAFACKEKFIDIADSNLQTAIAESDLIIIATPLASLGDIAKSIAPYIANGAIIMDVASVKQPAIEAIAPHIPSHAIFVPTHPIAGSEQTGVRSGRADLFTKKRIIITPAEPPEEELFKKISAFWAGMGAQIEAMPAEIHDLIYGYMSHLPQLIAFCLEKPLGKFYEQTEDNQVYKTFLRISNSNPELWADILELNKINILNSLERYIDVVSHVHNELKTAPEGEESKNDELLAYTVLFPRIVASCLVTTVMEAEKKAGVPFAKYAGTGFADMVAPTFIAPDTDIEHISAQYYLVEGILGEFILRLKLFRTALSNGNKP
jgi:cyclohexadieny/prephenate dehydrogenase